MTLNRAAGSDGREKGLKVTSLCCQIPTTGFIIPAWFVLMDELCSARWDLIIYVNSRQLQLKATVSYRTRRLLSCLFSKVCFQKDSPSLRLSWDGSSLYILDWTVCLFRHLWGFEVYAKWFY